jgi:hypothetical protein
MMLRLERMPPTVTSWVMLTPVMRLTTIWASAISSKILRMRSLMQTRMQSLRMYQRWIPEPMCRRLGMRRRMRLRMFRPMSSLMQV